ncbi:unnamed protein product [Caretta caretta]
MGGVGQLRSKPRLLPSAWLSSDRRKPESDGSPGLPLRGRLLLLLPSRMQSLCQELCLQSSSIQELQLLFLKWRFSGLL